MGWRGAGAGYIPELVLLSWRSSDDKLSLSGDKSGRSSGELVVGGLRRQWV